MPKFFNVKPFRKTSFSAHVAAQLITVVPVLCFAAIAVVQQVQRLQSATVAELQLHTELAADAVAREVEHALVAVQVLAVNARAQVGDVEEVRQIAGTLVKTITTIDSMSAFNRAGRIVFSTDLAAGEAPAWKPLPPGANAIFDYGLVWFGGVDADTARSGLTVGLAVPWRVNGVPTYGLRVSLKPTTLGAVMREQRWPDSWTAALLD